MTIQERARPDFSNAQEANKEVARQLIERIFIRQEDRAIDELVSADFVPHTFGPMPPGREGLREGMRRAGAGVSDPEFEIHDMVAEGDRVAVRMTTSARHTGRFMGVAPTGNRYSIDEIHVFRIGEGRLVEHWHAFDTMDLMRQLQGGGSAPGEASAGREESAGREATAEGEATAGGEGPAEGAASPQGQGSVAR